jgi:hypothetical protein
MANPEHLRILKEGVDVWNKWRAEHLEIRPDLNEAYFNGANLSGADLSRAKLGGADLRRANLSGADLRGAGLSPGARLRSANLTGADLRGADLKGARLSGARLSRANLGTANLIGADLRGAALDDADFTEARAGGTGFGLLDLSGVRGLDTVKHQGPSTIGLDTIYLSKGNIPEIFLRGAGVPEDFITFMKSLTGKALDFYSCFISYSSKDEEFARRLHAELQQANVRCWFAPEDLKIGDKFRTRIDESSRFYDKLMVILTENSIASSWVEDEVEAALEKERKQGKLVLFPIRLDDAMMDTDQAWAASLRRTRQIGDFRHWKDHDAFKTAFERLLRDLKSSG